MIRPAIPEPLMRLLDWAAKSYTKVGDYTASELAKPPKIAILQSRHKEEIDRDQDPLENLWTTFGTMMHLALEKMTDGCRDIVAEHRAQHEVLGKIVTGKADIWEHPGVISDYKWVKTGTMAHPDKAEWVIQLNILAYLFRRENFVVRNIQNVLIFRDWSQIMAEERGESYPQFGIAVVKQPLFAAKELESLVKDRVVLHSRYAGVSDDDIPECSKEERWYRGEKYACVKPGGKRASSLHDTEDEAKANVKAGQVVEFRPGVSVRCRICAVKKYCSHYNNIEKPLLESAANGGE